MSPPLPHWNPYGTPVVEGTTYHVPFEGRNTAMSVLRSPSKSPTTGRSALFPHANPVGVPVLEFIVYHVPFDGRNTVISALPSPSKSPGCGIPTCSTNEALVV